MEHVMPVTAGMGSGHPADEFGVNPGSLPTEDEESFKEAYKKAISPTNWAVQTQPRHILVNRRKGDTWEPKGGIERVPIEIKIDGREMSDSDNVWLKVNEAINENELTKDQPAPVYFPGFTEAELKALVNQNKGQNG